MRDPRKLDARRMQDRLLARIAGAAIERRFGNGESLKWKKILHGITYGASLRSVLTGRLK